MSAGLSVSMLPVTKVELALAVHAHFTCGAGLGDLIRSPRRAPSPVRTCISTESWARLTALPTTRSGFYVPSRCSPRERARSPWRQPDQPDVVKACPDPVSRSPRRLAKAPPVASSTGSAGITPQREREPLRQLSSDTTSTRSSVWSPRRAALAQLCTRSPDPAAGSGRCAPPARGVRSASRPALGPKPAGRWEHGVPTII